MLQTPLRLTAIVCSLLIGLGWLMFALDETRSASAQTAEIVAGNDAATRTDLSPDQERARERAHSTPRELIDDANDVLLAPFSSLASDSDNRWLRRTVPALIGLVVFGFGLAFLARALSFKS